MSGENGYVRLAIKSSRERCSPGLRAEQAETRPEVGADRTAAGRRNLGFVFAPGNLDAAGAYPGGAALVLRFLFVGCFLPGRLNPSPRHHTAKAKIMGSPISDGICTTGTQRALRRPINNSVTSVSLWSLAISESFQNKNGRTKIC